MKHVNGTLLNCWKSIGNGCPSVFQSRSTPPAERSDLNMAHLTGSREGFVVGWTDNSSERRKAPIKIYPTLL